MSNVQSGLGIGHWALGIGHFPFAGLLGLLIFVSALSLTTAQTATFAPRSDVNPAVLYWQSFSLYPELSDEIKRDFLSTPPRLSAEEAAPVLQKFDRMFKYLRRAAQMKVPCDWGIELADGPASLLPNLIKIRQCVNAAEARVHYALEAGRDQDAVDDLVAALVLGRNTGTDGTLVSTMVGIAVEGKVHEIVARHFYRFPPPALLSLLKQIEAAPPRPTVQQAMAIEQATFLEWFVAKLEGARAAHPGDDAKALASARELLIDTLDKDGAVDRIIEQAGGTTPKLIDYFKEMRPLYESMGKVLAAPPERMKEESAAFAKIRSQHPNLLAQLVFPDVSRARETELRAVARATMLRAAIALRLEGEAGFQKIQDPFGHGPFALRRLPAESGEVGFELDSQISSVISKNPALKFFEDAPTGVGKAKTE